jgi:hypothetical protein
VHALNKPTTTCFLTSTDQRFVRNPRSCCVVKHTEDCNHSAAAIGNCMLQAPFHTGCPLSNGMLLHSCCAAALPCCLLLGVLMSCGCQPAPRHATYLLCCCCCCCCCCPPLVQIVFAAGGRWRIDDDGKPYYINPKQADPSQKCTDVPPDTRMTCERRVRRASCSARLYVQEVANASL